MDNEPKHCSDEESAIGNEDLDLNWNNRFIEETTKKFENLKEIYQTEFKPRNFTKTEQKLMIYYLIINNATGFGLSTFIWKKMEQQQILKKRTYQSLLNNFKRSILPKIETYDLPQPIVQRFIDLRKTQE